MDREERIKKNKKKKKRKRVFKRITLFLVIIFTLFFTLKYIGAFNVKNISVKGPGGIDSSEIIKKSGLNEGSYFFSQTKESREKNIMSIPDIKDVKISFSPFRNVTITVSKRNPKAQIKNGKKYFIVDSDFKIINESNKAKDNIVVITGLNTKGFSLGEFILQKDSIYKEMLIKLFNSQDVYKYISKVEIGKNSFDFITKDEINIYMGSYKDLDYKFKMLDEILKDINETGKNVSSIEMEKGANPIVIMNSESDNKKEDNNKN